MLQELTHILQSVPGLLPELWLTVSFAGVILWDLADRSEKGKAFHAVTAGILLVAGWLVIRQWQDLTPGFLFDHLLVLDGKSLFFKLLVLFAGLVASLHSWLTGRKWSGEFFAVLIGLILGLSVLTMAANLLMVYLALETVSISSYILTAFRGDRKSAEGGLKYVLFGSVSSALMLYGMSLLYGITSTLDFLSPAFTRALVETDPLVSGTAVLLAITGLLFKISAAPLHIWNPDVYEAAETPVVSFFSVAPKAAAFLVLMRFLSVSLVDFQPVLAVISLATITIGNFSALWQKDAKRLMAYSSIAQSGFVLVGLVAFSELGLQSAISYLAAYLFGTMGSFFLLDVLSPGRSRNDFAIAGLAGLGRNYPLPGVLLTIALLSLVGIPMTVGFTAKLFLFSALWDGYQMSHSGLFLTLFAFGLFNTAVSLAVYVKIPFALFFRQAPDGVETPRLALPQLLLAVLLVAPVVVLFLRSDWLFNWVSRL